MKTRQPLFIFSYFTLFFCTVLHAQVGAPDVTFGTNGLSLLDHGAQATGWAFSVDNCPDGKIIVGGEAHTGVIQPFMVARFNANGKLDPTFGNAGIAVFSKWKARKVRALADGKILVMHYRGHQLTRLLADGSEDLSFQMQSLPLDPNRRSYSTDVAVLPDGTYLVCGAGINLNLPKFSVAHILQDGSLDTSFGVNGMSQFNSNYAGASLALALQVDGKILVTGGNGYDIPSVCRFQSNGLPDSTFGVNGLAKWPIAVVEDKVNPQKITVQPDGKIVMAAEVINGTQEGMAIFRMLSDGKPDNTFSEDGVFLDYSIQNVHGLILQSDGKIIAGGFTDAWNDYSKLVRLHSDGSTDNTYQTSLPSGTSEVPMEFCLNANGAVLAAIPMPTTLVHWRFGLKRLLDNGSNDPGFGNSGTAVAYFDGGDDQVKDMAVQTDGKVLVIGDSYSNYFEKTVLLARFTVDGALDPSFGSGGKKTIKTDNFSTSNYAHDIEIQTDGKIVAAVANQYVGEFGLHILRFNSNGTPDITFGLNGQVKITASIARFADMLLQADGKIILSGTLENKQFFVIRLLADGTLDPGFGSAGVAANLMGSSSENAFCTGMGLLPDGKILLAGNIGSTEIGVMRLKANGQLDNSFSGDGKNRFNVNGGISFYSKCMLVLSDGKILIGGSSTTPDYNLDFALIRIAANGNLDAGFGANGRAITPISGLTAGYCLNIFMQPDSNILAAGYASNTYSSSAVLLRYTFDGKLDANFAQGGIVVKQYGGSPANFSRVELQAGGKIVLAGSIASATDLDFALSRYYSGLVNSPVVELISSNITLYPNPCISQLNLNLPENFDGKDGTITIYDMAGEQRYAVRQVLTQHVQLHGIDFLPSGNYLVRVQYSNQNCYGRLVKTRL